MGENLDGILTLKVKDQTHLYKKLAELPFDSTRKCMSVIVRPIFSSDIDSDNASQQKNIYLFIKGAESVILPNCVDGPIEETYKIVDQFANQGLRTLVYAYKIMSQEEVKLFKEKVETAKQNMHNR